MRREDGLGDLVCDLRSICYRDFDGENAKFPLFNEKQKKMSD